MAVHQCPKCELRFNWKTELDDHCWHDHPEFHHEYPAHAVPPPPEPTATRTEVPPEVAEEHPHGRHVDGGGFVRWLVPRQRNDRGDR